MHPSPPPVTRPPKLTVIDIRLQRASDRGDAVPDIVDRFGVAEPIAVSVVTQGSAPSAWVAARVLREGRMVTEGRTEFAPTGTTATRFEVTPPNGWSPGRYTVQVLLDGQPAGEREFQVGGPGSGAGVVGSSAPDPGLQAPDRGDAIAVSRRATVDIRPHRGSHVGRLRARGEVKFVQVTAPAGGAP